jgi:hypothetical protein
MKLWPLVVVLVLAPAAAHADSTGGDVRVTVTCADYFVAPRDGLQLSVDGVVQPALGINWGGYWHHEQFHASVESDVGYAVARGHHHIALVTPDCAGSTDLDVEPAMPRMVTGSLAITNDALRGTVTAPNGLGVMVAGFYAPRPAHVTTDSVTGSMYDFDSTTQQGVQLTVTATYRHWVLALDQRYTSEGSNGTSAGVAFHGSAFDTGFVGRFGPRLSFHDVELAAGVGIGGDILHGGGHLPNTVASVTYDGRFFLPAWATLTYKPACDWGVQAIASYEFDPGSSVESTPTFAAGLLYQPSSACSQPPHLDVH